MLLPGAVVVFGFVWLIQLGVRHNVDGHHKDSPRLPEQDLPPSSAMDVLEKLYGRGEISRWEFERMKRDLRG